MSRARIRGRFTAYTQTVWLGAVWRKDVVLLLYMVYTGLAVAAVLVGRVSIGMIEQGGAAKGEGIALVVLCAKVWCYAMYLLLTCPPLVRPVGRDVVTDQDRVNWIRDAREKGKAGLFGTVAGYHTERTMDRLHTLCRQLERVVGQFAPPVEE